jgi:hypothetical protein
MSYVIQLTGEPSKLFIKSLKMKKLLIIACVAISSCSKKDNYKDISSTGIDYPTCPNNVPVQAPKIYLDHDYALDIVDDSVYLYTEDEKLVGVFKLEGDFEKLIISDNE